MSKKESIAMLLAGGQGSRLLALTRNIAKPAVSFGGKYRIIDFALSNCANSGIDTVGVLTQYRPYLLHSYIGTGEAWNLDSRDGGVSILPPYATEAGGNWYAGTADAIYQNIGYIESYDPKYIVDTKRFQAHRDDDNKLVVDTWEGSLSKYQVNEEGKEQIQEVAQYNDEYELVDALRKNQVFA